MGCNIFNNDDLDLFHGKFAESSYDFNENEIILVKFDKGDISFLIFIQFITIPASYLMLILEKQQFSLILNIIIAFTTIISITIGGLLKNVYVSFFFLSLLNGLVYAVYGFWFMNHAGLVLSKTFKILWRFLFMSLPVIIVVSLAKWFFHLSSFLLIIISCLGAIIFYGIGLKQDAKLQSLIKEVFLRLFIKTR